ncbi:hypothetical protein QUB80_18685 [Chlorogloeopsis sp. ULAP01]|uniref:hypothetical protein n=1 Tax=Chlorogloeopsis sp. ULAP01 TaxID=3056483 RepID=UPI0025AADC7F|nr:hypothetical protein [Chlorogloeopsis sp. ULAP01]MDM9382723.1 hypothetical protein [Chlorogloeopsis sp. ULAP01]
MKPFTSVVLATFLAAVATLPFEQSAKADIIIRFGGGNRYHRVYRPNYKQHRYRVYYPRYYRVYSPRHYPRYRIRHRSRNYPGYRVNYPSYYRIRNYQRSSWW